MVVLLSVSLVTPMWGQIDRKDVRRGNRDFRKENFREADIEYRKALVKDSLSVAANYNLASTLYRQGDHQQARQNLDRIKDVAPMTASGADYFYNLGDVALQQQDYQAAVDAFAQSLILRPDDLDAKENFIYAKKMLQNQQNQQQNQNNDQNQDQNNDQNNDQDQDQNKNDDQNKEQDKDQDQNGDQNQDDKQNDQNQDRNDQQQPQQGQQPKISPQAAQQMLQAIQAKEKETQDKVNRQKAEALKSRQKEKNW
jgi:tetratricopeptide (TPR) repeat protein